jgi:hypothetical protein
MEVVASLVDASGQCWGALNLMREAGHPFGERDIRLVQSRIGRGASAIARSMVAGAAPAGTSLEPGSVRGGIGRSRTTPVRRARAPYPWDY